MESLKVLLVANRGEIATRLIKTAKQLNIKTIAIYTEPDSASAHVGLADVACLLDGPPSTAYLDGEQIISIAKANGADAVIPGYGFLSENSEFATKVSKTGMVFVGPSTESIESFGLKHTARQLAIDAGVPIVPGTKGLLENEDAAVAAAKDLGFPVMLKATAGGGGMGLLTCFSEDEVRGSFRTVQSRGATLFKNAGLFLEKYYPASHHIEIQVFGNGQGKAIAFGERECSIQRRHQKVVEECPSPFIELKHPELREQLASAAVRLAESIGYGSAGTVEYLVDDETGSFFFLEMNTRLQVEHGITELCYNVDLVELMLRQADAQLSGNGGLAASYLDELQSRAAKPNGSAIELRVYAENPARNYAPSPGILQQVSWYQPSGSRIDTWVQTGTEVSAHYDPLLAKLMYHSPARDQTVKDLIEIVQKSAICGPPTNLDFLLSILSSDEFLAGHTITKFLDTFDYRPPAIDVIAGGAYTLIEDYPGRPTIGRGFAHAGPMDPVAFQIANALVGNPLGKEGLEITLSGPDLVFLGSAIVALCGAPMQATLDGAPFPMWTRVMIKPGQRLTIGKTLDNAGCRSYLAVFGGFPSVAEWFGSKATCPMVGIGGYQGRSLRSGDLLGLVHESDLPAVSGEVIIPESLRPRYSEHWDILAMVGPYDDGYLSPEDIEMLYNTSWDVSHNAARGGIRLIGPRPKWARPDGGDGGSHPSNLIEYGYPLGTLNWTGDEPCIFPVDCPDFGGFVSSTTIIKADYWKMGQLRAGNTLKFHRCSLDDAIALRKSTNKFLEKLAAATASGSFDDIEPINPNFLPQSTIEKKFGIAVVKTLEEKDGRPLVSYRQGADDYMLVDYGHGSFDLNHRCRATALNRALKSSNGPISFSSGLINTVGCGNAVLIYYDGLKISQKQLLDYLMQLEEELGDLRTAKIPNRRFELPITFNHQKLVAGIQRYMDTQRPYASYLPDTFDFVARNNGITTEQLKKLFLDARFIIIGVGFFTALPQTLPYDPRHRLNAPKMNPSRTFTPEGTASWGGSCMSIYNVESPGGYQLTGMTIPGVDILGSKKGYSTEKPWLYEEIDEITFYEVTEEEYDKEMALFKSGRYEYKVSDSCFDMAHHNELLQSTKDEVIQMKTKQAEAQAKMVALEKELLEKWAIEKEAAGIKLDTIQSLLDDPQIETIEAPLNANVWKVLVNEGEKIKAGQVVSILEAMKLEINVVADEKLDGTTVEKLLIKPNDVVQSGMPLILTRRAE